MSSLYQVFGAVALLSISGLPACLFSARSSFSQKITVVLMFTGAVSGIYGVVVSLMSADIVQFTHEWFLPIGSFSIRLDPLSCVFLLPVFIIPALGSIYSLGYWPQKKHQENGQRLGVFYGLLAGAMALIVISADSVLFLIAWEIMAIAAFFAATTEDEDKQVRQAGWVYLIATHIGTLCLFGMFALWKHQTGSFSLVSCPQVSAGVAGALFILAVIGFGFKAGIMPLHLWLPGAHANAPSHVSAVMSGVMLKVGIYGIIRMTSLLPSVELWWSGLLMATGGITAIAGIAFAIGQQDIKRMLAYSSIENIGIIMLGIGLSLAGRYFGRADLVLFGLGGALLHVWNHSLFKSLLFLNSGAIIHMVHSRDIEAMGGLGKRMPLTMALFMAGAIAITALPPLNGFISEWLLYLGFFRSLDISGAGQFSAIPLGVIALAVVGPLALACFVKMSGFVFMGNPRSSAAEHARESPGWMLLSMLALVIGCVAIGLFPNYPVTLLMNTLNVTIPEHVEGITRDMYKSLYLISYVGAAIFAVTGCILFLLRKQIWNKDVTITGTWDCGYARPTKRMQYSGSSFGDSIVRLLSFFLFPVIHYPDVSGKFPQKATFRTSVPDVVLDRLMYPFFRRAGYYLTKTRIFQIGQIHLYVLYILLIVLVLFVIGR